MQVALTLVRFGISLKMLKTEPNTNPEIAKYVPRGNFVIILSRMFVVRRVPIPTLAANGIRNPKSKFEIAAVVIFNIL